MLHVDVLRSAPPSVRTMEAIIGKVALRFIAGFKQCKASTHIFVTGYEVVG